MKNTVEFKLGTFSYGGCKPYAGIIIDNEVAAVESAFIDFRSKNPQSPYRLYGAGSTLGLLQEWDESYDSLFTLAEYLSGKGGDEMRERKLLVKAKYLHIHPPILLPRQIFCTGVNYPRHVKEMQKGLKPNSGKESSGPASPMKKRRPYAFIRLPSTVTGPYDNVIIGPPGEQHDWEIELAVIIGRKARRVSHDEAMDYVAGFTICNDISTRDLTFREDIPVLGADWLASKNRPTYFPLGPFLTPKQFVKNPHNLHMKMYLNGELKQDASTSEMIRDIGTQIEYISAITTLFPGDVIATGSPHGNGVYWDTYLKPGDSIVTNIGGLGEQRNQVVSENI